MSLTFDLAQNVGKLTPKEAALQKAFAYGKEYGFKSAALWVETLITSADDWLNPEKFGSVTELNIRFARERIESSLAYLAGAKEYGQ